MKLRLLFLLLLTACASAPAVGPLVSGPAVPADPLPLTLPFAEVEAETGRTTGAFSSFTTSLYDPGAEASGRRFVALPPGAELRLAVPVAADGLVVRTSWPDGLADGHLEAAVDGQMWGSLVVTSRYTWEYGRPNWGTSNVWDGGSGPSRHYWDETSARGIRMEAGQELVLGNPANAKGTVLVDLVDFELVPDAVPVPAGAVNFADFAPDATGKTDVTALLQKALDKARGGTLYIPEGVYRTDSVYLANTNVVGAGMWRTRFVGPISQFRFEGKTASLTDFAIFGETNTRDDTSDEVNGLAGNPGPNSTITRVWIEHKKCAFWVGQWNGKTPVNGLVIAECRFRDLMADAVNFCSGTINSTVRDTQVRNSGDDALAAWSPRNGGTPGGNNSFLRNYIQLPWVASGIALYGGGPFLVAGNVVKDTVTTGSGLYIAANFGAWPFTGKVDARDNLFVRAGAHESDPGGTTGAIRLLAQDGDMGGATYVFTNTTILDPLDAAVSFHGPRGLGRVEFNGLKVRTTNGVVDVKRNASNGLAVFHGVEIEGNGGEFEKGEGTWTF